MRRGQHIWARLTAVYHARSKGCDRIRSAVAIPTRTRGDRTATTHHIREDRTSQMLGDRDGAGIRCWVGWRKWHRGAGFFLPTPSQLIHRGQTDRERSATANARQRSEEQTSELQSLM